MTVVELERKVAGVVVDADASFDEFRVLYGVEKSLEKRQRFLGVLEVSKGLRLEA